jgi:FdhE protein
MARSGWEKRIRRADQLAGSDPSANQLLGFYAHVLQFQLQMRRELDALGAPGAPPSAPLSEQLDVEFALRWMPRLLDAVQKHGPEKLGTEAERIKAAGNAEQRRTLAEFLRNGSVGIDASSYFLALVLFQPAAEFAASKHAVPSAYTAAICPFCGSKPQLAVLRPEGDGGKRHLLCSLCLTEWEFRRVLCPMCEEVDHAKLPRYSAEDPIAVRVEACDACKTYLKSFDMTVDGLIVPEVEEVATVALDAWAAEHGYHKLQLNILGF